jgi:parallel beta-helix repeat protein
VGGGSGIAFNILANASGTTIAGIVITNYAQAIFIDGASNCKIYDNIMTQNVNSGIAEGNSAANNLIYSNIFQQNPGVAINLTQYSTGNTIYSNTFILNSIGLNIESGGNTIYWNIFIDNTRQADIEDPLHNTNAWDNGYPDGGNYWSTHISVDLYRGPNQNEVGSDGINDTQCTIAVNNIDYYPLVKPFSPHDIGITNVILSKTVIGQGFTLSIDLKILNYGIYDELFTVTIYADTSIIATQITTLTKRNSTTITFTWNVTGFAKGNYTISAYAWPVLGEIETIDNTLKDGWIIITMIGDIVPDGTVDIFDIVTVAVAYGSTPSDPNWNPNADLVEDNIIDIFDLVTIAIHFGETDP